MDVYEYLELLPARANNRLYQHKELLRILYTAGASAAQICTYLRDEFRITVSRQSVRKFCIRHFSDSSTVPRENDRSTGIHEHGKPRGNLETPSHPSTSTGSASGAAGGRSLPRPITVTPAATSELADQNLKRDAEPAGTHLSASMGQDRRNAPHAPAAQGNPLAVPNEPADSTSLERNRTSDATTTADEQSGYLAPTRTGGASSPETLARRNQPRIAHDQGEASGPKAALKSPAFETTPGAPPGSIGRPVNQPASSASKALSFLFAPPRGEADVKNDELTARAQEIKENAREQRQSS